jgi:hypothetical protein
MGIVMGLCASGAAFGLTDLALTALAKRDPGHTGLLFLPEFGVAILTAALFATIVRTRYIPVLAVSGLLVLVAGAATLLRVAHASDVRIAISAALLGLGVGASVAPSLFLAGFSLSSKRIQRVFALVELLRAVGAFLFAPILLFITEIDGSNEAAGLRTGAWICLGVAAAGAVLGVGIFLLGHAGLQTPDVERWNAGEPAWESPPLLAQLRD